MNRLVQGDVGSGKTMVAAAAAYLAVKNQKQAALMAPTEILAEQHFASLEKLLTPLGVRVCLLTGGLTQKNKNLLRQAIETGQVDLIVCQNLEEAGFGDYFKRSFGKWLLGMDKL